MAPFLSRGLNGLLALFVLSLLTFLPFCTGLPAAQGEVSDNGIMSGVALRWRGACRCPNHGFQNAVQTAFITVRAHVMWRGEIHRLSKSDRRLLIRGYKFRVSQNFGRRGPRNGQSFYAEAFDNVDFCGVRLAAGQTYLLNIANPARRSAGSHWPKGVYVLDACEMHYGWRALRDWQKNFLWSRVRK